MNNSDYETIIKETIIRKEMKAELKAIHDRLYGKPTAPQSTFYKLTVFWVNNNKKLLGIAAIGVFISIGIWNYTTATHLSYLQIFNSNKYELNPEIVQGVKGIEIDNESWIASFRQKDYSKSITMLTQICKHNDIEPFTPYFLGVAYMETGQTDLALHTFTTLLAQNPNLFVLRKNAVYYQIALCYVQKKDKKNALHTLSKIDIQHDIPIQSFVHKLQTSLQ